MKTKPPKPCQWSGCAHDAVPTERYCSVHRRAMLRKMEQDGYLQEIPRATRRGSDASENVRETKYGIDR